MVFNPVFAVVERPGGAETTTTRRPSAAPASMLAVAVSEVPSPLVFMLETLMLKSAVPLSSMNLIEVVPPRFAPVRVMDTVEPVAAVAGETEEMYGPLVTDTPAITAWTLPRMAT